MIWLYSIGPTAYPKCRGFTLSVQTSTEHILVSQFRFQNGIGNIDFTDPATEHGEKTSVVQAKSPKHIE